MRTYYVYIVECSDGSYYTGLTHDVDKRVAEHNLGLNERCYTYMRRPVEVVFSADFKEVDDAIAFEKQVKGWSRKKKRAIIEGRWKDLPSLSRSNPVRRSLDRLGRPSTTPRA